MWSQFVTTYLWSQIATTSPFIPRRIASHDPCRPGTSGPLPGALHPALAAAIAFLRGRPLGDLPEGRIEIAGTTYAMVSRSPARRRSEARLEAHRKHIDIQYVIAGVEEMGWTPRNRCQRADGPYDAEKDIEFFSDAPESYVTVRAGELVIFFPHDAHAPLIGAGEVHKIVVKVAV
jgi:biofilm protein TabA